MSIFMHPRARLLVLLLAGLVLACPAWAQFGSSPGSGSIATGGSGARTPAPPKPPEPAAIPGARTNGGPAPLTRAPSEMGPNEALFDAVNRGDIAAARDATARGADVNARNILGLTALELAVDIGQNDIAFLLLSLRDAEPSPRPNTRPGGRPPATAQTPPAARRPATPARTVSAAPQRPAQSDGGAPVPNAGFLGFGR